MSTVIQSPQPIVAQPAVDVTQPAIDVSTQPTVAPVVAPAVAPAIAPRLRPATIAPNLNPNPVSPSLPALSPTTATALGLPATTNPQDDYLNNLLAVDTSNSLDFSSGESGWSFSSLFSFSWIGVLGYLVRVGILFGLIFLFTSIIPQQELALNTRLLIAGTVVLFYALLDVFRKILAKIKALICSAACGCN